MVAESARLAAHRRLQHRLQRQAAVEGRSTVGFSTLHSCCGATWQDTWLPAHLRRRALMAQPASTGQGSQGAGHAIHETAVSGGSPPESRSIKHTADQRIVVGVLKRHVCAARAKKHSKLAMLQDSQRTAGVEAAGVAAAAGALACGNRTSTAKLPQYASCNLHVRDSSRKPRHWIHVKAQHTMEISPAMIACLCVLRSGDTAGNGIEQGGPPWPP